MDSRTLLRIAAHAAAGLALSVGAAASAAGQTLLLTQSNATVLRGGTYADMNLSSDLVLSTRASSDATYVRRIVLKFDTQSPLPAGTPITSAILTLTVAGGNAEARTLSAYRVNSSYEAPETTWNRRNASTLWTSAGGD